MTNTRAVISLSHAAGIFTGTNVFGFFGFWHKGNVQSIELKQRGNVLPVMVEKQIEIRAIRRVFTWLEETRCCVEMWFPADVCPFRADLNTAQLWPSFSAPIVAAVTKFDSLSLSLLRLTVITNMLLLSSHSSTFHSFLLQFLLEPTSHT